MSSSSHNSSICSAKSPGALQQVYAATHPTAFIEKEKTPQPSNGNHGEAHTAITDLLTTLDREATEDDEG
ncbi:MAG TPA: hypothetical protein VNO32_05290 [Candidatus Acidoferrum sp.]|jgi:hypothetical protein|nr:hypothetical protein [Candidatus Acidoferrum sp.]